MAVKAINNTAGLDGLVFTLLVYGAYLRISKLDPSTRNTDVPQADLSSPFIRILTLTT